MKNIWKNVLGVALIAAISSGAAIGTSTYLMNKNQRPAELASGVENTFKQPYRLTNYGTVAAENIDFTTAAESAIHGVVHIKATANAQASNGDGGQQYMDPVRVFLRLRWPWRVPTSATATSCGRWLGCHYLYGWLYHHEQPRDRRSRRAGGYLKR